MSIRIQVALRTKKLGVLIRDARLAARRSIPECSAVMGVTRGILRAYEEGRRAPSLPELEVLAYYLNLPLGHFWSGETLKRTVSILETLKIPELIGLRQRMIGALLRKQRLDTGLSPKSLCGLAEISTSRLKAYEMGETPIPTPELENLMGLMNSRIETLFDQSGPIGQWLAKEKNIQDFLELPPELQAFVTKPVNRPYIDLAQSLSGLSSEKLRSVAETLLEITL